MTLIINKKSVKAFVNQEVKPSLVVEKLNIRQSGKLGIFVGDGAGGDFERITIEH
jgi:hypothetical protein